MTVKEFRDLMEIVYFVTAGPCLLVVAAFGLRQLKIAKDTAKMSAKREAYKLTADQCSVFSSQILPMASLAYQAIHNEGFDALIDNHKVTIEKDTYSVNFSEIDQNPVNLAALGRIDSITLDLLNSMEAFSLFFISGVADEQISFTAVGPVFCRLVRRLLPILAKRREDETLFPNLTKLFLIWNGRIETAKLEAQEKEIAERKKATNKTILPPMGTQ